MRLFHLTDTHIFAEGDGTLKGVNTTRTLQQVLRLVDRAEPSADAFVITGDVSQDGSQESYRRLAEMFAYIDVPVFALSGNHDNRASMMRAFVGPGGNIRMDNDFIVAGWQVVMLNSTVAGQEAGEISDAELGRLENVLSVRPNLHALVCLHHPPINIATRWLDEIGLRNGKELFKVLARHHNVRAVLCGHVHQDIDVVHEGIRVISTPSTNIQFEPGAQKFTMDKRSPGYRWLDLLPDGQIKTGVRRARKVPEFVYDPSDR